MLLSLFYGGGWREPGLHHETLLYELSGRDEALQGHVDERMKSAISMMLHHQSCSHPTATEGQRSAGVNPVLCFEEGVTSPGLQLPRVQEPPSACCAPHPAQHPSLNPGDLGKLTWSEIMRKRNLVLKQLEIVVIVRTNSWTQVLLVLLVSELGPSLLGCGGQSWSHRASVEPA